MNNRNLAQRLERLPSGLRINRAAGDAAGLSVSEGFRLEINGMMVGNWNTEAAINLIQTAEGALNEVSVMLIRMRELLSGFGNTADIDLAFSTALASPITGVIATQLSSAAAGTYAFDDSLSDNQITLDNGVATQMIDIGTGLDVHGDRGVVATGSSIIANFDRLDLTLTLDGSKPAEGINPATDGYRDGDLNGRLMVVNQGFGTPILSTKSPNSQRR
jgi:flagellin